LFPRAARRGDICGNLLPESYSGHFCSAIAHQSPPQRSQLGASFRPR
jgi:hypothetical protein